MHTICSEEVTEQQGRKPAARCPGACDSFRRKPCDFRLQSFEQYMKSRRVWRTAPEVEQVRGITKQNPACPKVATRRKKIVRRHGQRALKAGECNEQPARVCSLLDKNVRFHTTGENGTIIRGALLANCGRYADASRNWSSRCFSRLHGDGGDHLLMVRVSCIH